MGEVYLAERADDQFCKQVTIQVIRPEMASAELLRRFRHQRQMLARLEHPHIARLIDGGLTDDDIPYFVMEYVAGEPILAYCDRRELSARRLRRVSRSVCGSY
jgi:eukaryotic-like serine/threonine-protein kinase